MLGCDATPPWSRLGGGRGAPNWSGLDHKLVAFSVAYYSQVTRVEHQRRVADYRTSLTAALTLVVSIRGASVRSPHARPNSTTSTSVAAPAIASMSANEYSQRSGTTRVRTHD